jgi:hypothetical protein
MTLSSGSFTRAARGLGGKMAYVAPGYVAPGYVADEEGAGTVNAAVAAFGAVIYTGTAAVVASIIDSAGTVTAEVAAAGTVVYDGAASILAFVNDPGAGPAPGARTLHIRAEDRTLVIAL